MAYNTSNEWKTKVEGDDKSYVSYLLLNNSYIPMEQISKIDFIEDIIDSDSESMYLGTFRSNQIDITFKNLNGLNIESNLPVYLEIGLDTNNKAIDCEYKYEQDGLKYFELLDDEEYEYIGINKYINISVNGVMYNRLLVENYIYPDEDTTYFGINLYQLSEIETTDEIIVYPYEYIPKGYYLIEEPDENYYNTCKITCLDYAVKLKTNCDYSSALDYVYLETNETTYLANKIYYKLENNEYIELVVEEDYEIGDEITGVIYEKTDYKAITIENLLKWICLKYGVSLGTYPNINRNVLISVYDSTLSAKKYISYIAEIMGGNAKFNRQNELCIMPIKTTPIMAKNALKRETFKTNEKYEVTKVYYTDGSRVFEYGNDNANTLQIRQENMFIVDTNVVQNIYNSVNGLIIYSLETKAPADLSLDCWDIINFQTDYDEESEEYLTYPTFNNHKTTYAISMIGTVLTKIPTKQQEKTTNVVENTDADNIRRIQTEINQMEGTFTVLAEDISATKSDINNNYYNKGTIDTLITDATSGVVNTFTTVGGDNVFRNTGLWFHYEDTQENHAQNKYWEYWNGNANKINEIKATNGNAIVLKNDTFSQTQNVNIGTYTISFVYKKLVPLANVTMEINNKEYPLDEEEFTVFSETSYFDSGQISIEFISDTENSCEIYDLMVNVGETSLPYNQNQNEITTSTVQISEGITINNTNEDTTFKADADGIRVKDKNTGENITYYTKVGMETKQAKIKEQSEIVGLLFQRVNGQTWISWLGDE